jgi:Xaa-Pro aminopeptidase
VPEAHHWVRIENTYLITQTGAEILSKGTIELRDCNGTPVEALPGLG